MISKIQLATVFLMSTTIASQAQVVQECLNFSDDDLRLACYDEKAGYEASDTASENSGTDAEVSTEGWVFVENTDAFSGKDTSSVFLASDAWDDNLSDKPSAMVIRCDGKGSYEIIVMTHGYLGGDRIRVRYKFGENDPVSERWSASSSGRAAFLPSGYKDFLRGIISEEDFIFEVTDFNGSRKMASFKDADKGTEKRDFVLGGCKK